MDKKKAREEAQPVAWTGADIPEACPYPSLGKKGAPYAYSVDPGAGSAMDRLQREWPDPRQIADLQLRGGSVTPLFPPATPPAPEAEKLRVAVEGLLNLPELERRQQHLRKGIGTATDEGKIVLQALAALQQETKS